MSGMQVDLRKKYFPDISGEGRRQVLGKICFSAKKGEFLAIVGPSGCGKTTLLNLVAGLDADYEGNIALEGMAEKAVPNIGYVFQTPRLLPWRTVFENVGLVLKEPAPKEGFVEKLLAEAGLTEFRDAYPEKLSLGQQRRAAIVRAFAIAPDLLLMDEPFVSLDRPTAERLRRLLLDIWGARPTTVLFVTHDLDEAIALADRVLVLSDSPATLLADVPIAVPRDERTGEVLAEFRQRLQLLEKP
ncbi:ABC transporter ATP-binding protein [Rhodospirillaceae bacterium AH-315-P19]|nr:ABC transporter ATP-binding protein [Rhodospirillaceae bacterium AH-315-P19]